MANSEQYKNQIRDFHDLDIAFQFADKSKTSNDQNVKDNLELLIKTLYKDILSTRRESDKKNIDKIEVVFSQQTNELLDKMGGLASIFDKAKTIVEEEIKNGKIEQQDKDKILSDVQKELQKRLDKYRKGEGREKSGDKITYVSPEAKQLNEFTRNILNNEKLVKKMSDSLKGTIHGQSKKQSISIINLLTGNKYKELSLKIKKDNISRISTLMGKTTKLQVFSKIKEFKNSEKLGKMFNHRTILKHFKVKRQKLDKRGFLGLYNQYVYKELIRRVDEFSNVLNFKGRMGKAILKSVLKWGGGFIVSGITKTLGFGWKMMKSAVKQIFNITKAVGKMGVSIFRRLRNFIFTKTGMWIVGFFSGVIYAAVIEPLVKKFKAWFDLILNPFKEWLGIGEKDEITIERIKTQMALKLKNDVELEIKEQRNKKIADSLIKITNMFSEVEEQLEDIDLLMNGGGWKRAAAGAVAGSAGTIGTLVGFAIGSLFPGVGNFVGAAIGGAIGGFVASSVNYFAKRIRKNSKEKLKLSEHTRDIRDRWTQYARQNDRGENNEQYQRLVMQRRAEKVKIDETQNRIDELNRILEHDPNNKQALEERQNLLSELQKSRQVYDNYGKEIDRFGYNDNEHNNEIIDKISEKLLETDGYYFDLTGFHSMQKFFDDAQKGVFKKNNPEKQNFNQKDFTQDDIGRVKTHAFRIAIVKYNNGELDFENIPKYADSYMMSIMKKGKSIVEGAIRQSKDPKRGSVRIDTYRLPELDQEYYDFDEEQNLSGEFDTIIGEMEREGVKVKGPNGEVVSRKITDVAYHKNALWKIFNNLYFQDINGYDRETMKQKLLLKWAELEVIKNNKGKKNGNAVNPILGKTEEGFTENTLLEILQLMSEAKIKMIRTLDENVITKEQEEEFIRKSSKITIGENDQTVKQELKEIDILKKTKKEKNAVEEELKKKKDDMEKKVEPFRKQKERKVKEVVTKIANPFTNYIFVTEEQDDGTSANDEGGISYLYNRNTPQKPSWMK